MEAGVLGGAPWLEREHGRPGRCGKLVLPATLALGLGALLRRFTGEASVCVRAGPGLFWCLPVCAFDRRAGAVERPAAAAWMRLIDGGALAHRLGRRFP